MVMVEREHIAERNLHLGSFRTYSKRYHTRVISGLEPYGIPRVKINIITMETGSLNNHHRHATMSIDSLVTSQNGSTLIPGEYIDQGR